MMKKSQSTPKLSKTQKPKKGGISSSRSRPSSTKSSKSVPKKKRNLSSVSSPGTSKKNQKRSALLPSLALPKAQTDNTADFIQQTRDSKRPNSRDCLVVGIGASAGGLESFKRFLEVMPHDSGIAFVLIQHLDPNHESLMADLLSKYTSMPVVEAKDATPIEANHVYMIPPNKFIKIADGGLFLDEPIKVRGMRMPIDYFFRSLAEARKHRAVCIVLSGTGSDGSQGLREIKAAGGMTIAQQPQTAEYTGMPQSAMATGMVDFVITIREMPALLENYVKHPYIHSDENSRPISETFPDHFKAIMSLLRAHTDYDFRSYKKGTLNRRIERRMGLRHIQNLGAYVKLLRGDPREVRDLFKDLLIGVTHFFRDKEAWQILAEEVLPRIVANKTVNEVIRVWVPGCATGEEAFSLSILLHEELERQKKSLDIQIFATDLDADAISYSRLGIYPANIAEDITPARLSRYFSESEEKYKVNKRLRASVVFAPQNLIGDPPFSNLDLITCRNVLIYLENEIQHKLLDIFHFALREGGYLFLGNSESVGKHARAFEVISKTWRIYRTIGVKRRLSQTRVLPERASDMAVAEVDTFTAKQHLESIGSTELAKRLMLNEFAPASVVINAQMDIQYYHGPVKKYLDFPSGEATNDLMVMILEQIRPKLRSTIHSVLKEKTKASITVPRVPRNGKDVSVKLSVYPVPVPKNRETLLLVTFQDEADAMVPVARTPTPDQKPIGKKPKKGIRKDQSHADRLLLDQLEYELQATREDLQSTIEELETSNEELKASNEEVMSMNEELQSTNEELETSREELQSLNEELNTVNTQLEEKVNELEHTNNDLHNLISSTDLATVFLDTHLCIRRFTDAAADLLHIRKNDVGRPITELAPQVNDPTLLQDIQSVLQKLQPVEQEVQNGGDKWYIRRILPYRTGDNKIEGVVITFTNITTIKESNRRVEIRESQQAMVARVGHAGIITKNLQEFFDQVVKHTADTLNVPLIKILERLPNHAGFLLRSGMGWKSGLVGKAIVPGGNESQAGYTLINAGPIIVKDLSRDRRFSGPALLNDHKVVSGMSVMIGSSEDPWGIFGVHTVKQRVFTVDDVNFLQAISNILYGAISNLRTREKLEEDVTRASLIHEATQLGNEIQSLEEALKGSVRIISRLTGWTLGHAYMLNHNQYFRHNGEWIEIQENKSLGKFKQYLQETSFFMSDNTFVGRTASRRTCQWIKDLHHDRTFADAIDNSKVPLKGAFAFPINVHQKTVAVIEFFHTDAIEPSDQLVETIEILAHQFNHVFERRLAELNRIQMQNRLDLITKSGCVGMWEWNPRTDQAEWNEVLYELLGLDPAAPSSGSLFFQHVFADDRQPLQERIDQVIKRGTHFDHEFRVTKPDGQVRWLVGRGEIDRTVDDGPVIRGINMDITSQKQAEEELQRINKFLEERVKERTNIAEQRALQLRGLALKFSDFEETVRQKTAQVMHDDFQQLLVAIRIRLQTDLTSPSEQLQEIDALIEKALQCCKTLVLDLSPPVMMQRGMQAGLQWLARRAKEQHNLSVVLNLPDEDVEPNRQIKSLIFRSVQELLFNIVKHAQIDHAMITLECSKKDLSLIVEDSGCGFDAQSMLDYDREINGFGLFAIQERILSMNGTMTIDSNPGQGTRITIVLPYNEPGDHVESDSTSSDKFLSFDLATPITSHKGGIRLIIADDHTTVRDGFISILSQEPDFQVLAGASDGQEAISLSRRHRPDVVLMDINMQGLNGVEATRQIKKEMPEVKVIGLSMHDTPEVKQSILDVGALDFVPKGSSITQLVETIRRIAKGDSDG